VLASKRRSGSARAARSPRRSHWQTNPGHADIIRESIDGGQAMQLMAQAEGWADQLAEWMKQA